MSNFITTFMERRSDLWLAIGQHIQLSLISLLIAMLIAIPLAISVLRTKRLANVLTQITGVFQTIPSLALLGLLIPLVGIGTVPAIIALVVYAILPIFQSTYTGISSIDTSLEEAADAFGLTRWEKLRKIEFPIALPAIIAGIRQALVMIIGTATLAALIGAGGLGNFILLGIDRNNNAMTLIGAISSALLAIIFSGLILLLQRLKLRYSVSALLVVLLIPLGVQVYQQVKSVPEQITIAGKLGSEPDILINMYRDLIKESNPHAQITLKPNFGQTSFLFNALKSHQIDIYPEFTGTVLESLVKVPKGQKELGVTRTTLYQYARNDLQKQFKMSFLAPMAYNNTYAVVVKQSFAKQYHLKTIADLQTVEQRLHGGFDLEFLDRTDGYRGLESKYNLHFKTQSMDPDLRYEALNDSKINITDGYSTDSQIRQYHLVALQDNRNLFPTYQGAPLMSTRFADQHSQVVHALDKLTNRISEQDMQEMNYEVNVKRQSAATVAKHYLTTHHLLGDD